MPISKEHEEYEIIPVSPLRRLERKIEELEARIPLDNREVFREIVSVIRMNQEIVNELVKSTNELKSELSKLPIKLDQLIANLNELIEFIRASGEEEVTAVTQEAMKPVVEKLDKLIEYNRRMSDVNESLLMVLDNLEKRLRAVVPTRPPLPKPPVVKQPVLPKHKVMG